MLTVENTWKEVQEANVDTAILPVGAVEQHGHHLPLGTDWYMADGFCRKLAERLGNVLLLPAVPYGCSVEHMAFPGTVTLRPATLAAIVEDIIDSLAHHGIRYVIVHSSHGGNWIVKPTLREINFRRKDVTVLWYNGALADDGEEIPQDIHSGANETGGMLLLHPELVKDHDSQPDSPGFVGNEFNDYVGYDKTTKTGAWGRPAKADVEATRQRVDEVLNHSVRYIHWVKQKIADLRAEEGCL